MSVPKIEKGIAMPQGWRRIGGSISYVETLRAMEVGDSFAWPTKPHDDLKKVRQNAASAGWHLRPKKFATRTVVENGKQIIRIWRVA